MWLTLMLLIAPMTATGIVQNMHKNHTNAVKRMFIVLVFANGLMVFFQIYDCDIRMLKLCRNMDYTYHIVRVGS
jgi:hypothetical protein